MPKNAQTTAQLHSSHTLVGFYPWVGKFLCRREWQFTPVFLSGELHGQRSLVGYSLGGSKRVRHDWVTNSVHRGTKDQIADIYQIIEKAREFQKNIYFCVIDYAKAFDCVDHNKQWKIIPEVDIPDHLTCLLRNLYAGQEPTVKTGHRTTDWFQIRKGVHQGCILSPCLFNFYAEYIMRNAGLEEAQLKSRLPGETVITSDMQMTPLLWQKAKRT